MDNFNKLVHSSTEILRFFESRKDFEPTVKLLEIYDEALENNKAKKALIGVEVPKRHPLIVLEGLDGSGKSTVGRKLARKLDGVQMKTPPTSLANLRPLFDQSLSEQVRIAFYCLSNYIAALEIELMLWERPVILDRYWHSTIAFNLAQKIHDFPNEFKLFEKGSDFYKWPVDLLKPDLVILLRVKEAVRMQRLSKRMDSTNQEKLLKEKTEFRQNIYRAYSYMENPGVTEINANSYINKNVAQIMEKATELFPELTD